jgi:hypothetical protein
VRAGLQRDGEAFRQITVQFLGGHMKIKIGDGTTMLDISKFIQPPSIDDTFRSQSVNKTLNGSLVVDRISELTKKRIAIQLPMITLEKWTEIKQVITPITFKVQVDDKEYTMHLDGDTLPTPVLFADGENIMCSDISLTFEEM